jgi:hypothetical protein
MGSLKVRRQYFADICKAAGVDGEEIADNDELTTLDLDGVAQVAARAKEFNNSVIYVLARVDLMQNRLVVSAYGIVIGWWLPTDERMTAKIVNRSPEPYLVVAEIKYYDQVWIHYR